MNTDMPDCLFCRIINREIPASIVYEDERVLAFNDINPQAPTHVLVVPKRHIASLNDLGAGDDQVVGELVRRAAAMARDRGVSASGFRTVFNTNRDAGQTVFHIHLHLLGGRSLQWPPGSHAPEFGDLVIWSSGHRSLIGDWVIRVARCASVRTMGTPRAASWCARGCGSSLRWTITARIPAPSAPSTS